MDLSSEVLKQIKPLAMGEFEAKAISKGKPTLMENRCVFCDREVWISSIGYNRDDPELETQPDDTKRTALHKLCFMAVAQLTIPAFMENAIRRYGNAQ